MTIEGVWSWTLTEERIMVTAPNETVDDIRAELARVRAAVSLLGDIMDGLEDAIALMTAGFMMTSPLLRGANETLRVTQEFGERPGYYAQWGLPGHEGIDLGAAAGRPVVAVADGRVYRTHADDGSHNYGNHVRLEHAVSGATFKSIYAHLSRIDVSVGEVVKRGQAIGAVGSTGNSTAPHLHLTLKRVGATAAGLTTFPGDIVDPRPYFANGVIAERSS